MKLEQNLGCELPVCVSNRKEMKRDAIEFKTDDGTQWKLVRAMDTLLPAPEHYPYWLWILDRFKRAADHQAELPMVALDPPEIFDMFGGPASYKIGGSRYNQLDDAFLRFASITVDQHGILYDFESRKTWEGRRRFHLIDYLSWRVKPHKNQEVLDFVKGHVVPSPFLWQSIKSGFVKSIPLEPIKKLSYIGQRLYTYLHKHCRPGGEFVISAAKLLPKIPMSCAPDQLQRRLDKHHDDLAKIGFLDYVEIQGRGSDKVLVYQRKP